MIINFVLPGRSMRYPMGGYKVVYEYANGLVKRGHQVNVIHPLLWPEEKLPNVHKLKMYCKYVLSSLFEIPKINWFDISPKVNMMTVLTPQEKYIPPADVIVATAWRTAEWVNTYDQNKGDKFYLIQHYEDWCGEETRVRATWKMPLKKIVVARWLQKRAWEMGEDRVVYIPRGLDFEHFHITQPIEKRSPKRIGMSYHKLDWKGSKDGIRALSIVKDKMAELQVVFFSVCQRGPEVPEWVAYYRNLLQRELRKLYNSCAIFLSPDWFGEWGLPIAEAMACGCAVTCTDSNGAEEYGFHNRTALVSRPKDPIALAQNIMKLLQDDHLRITLAKQGNKYIKTFTWDKAVDKMEAFLSGRLDKSHFS